MTDEEMTTLTADAKTVSDKIRILDRAGVKKADIGRFLNIRYQHVYNVLDRDRRKGGSALPKTAAAGPTFTLKLSKNGQISLPSEYLEEEGLSGGDLLVCRRDPDGIRIMTRTAAVEHVRKLAHQRMPDEAGLLELLLERLDG